MNYGIQILSAVIGSIGFGMLFHLTRAQLPLAAVGGGLSWLFYLLGSNWFHDIFPATLFASLGVALYAEILARICKAPSTPFFAISVIPLIPGSSLYHCMFNFVQAQPDAAMAYGRQTFSVALAIAAGMSIMWTFCDLYRKFCAALRKIYKGEV